VKSVTRREFLETSALATLGVAANTSLPKSIKEISAPYLRKKGSFDKVIILGMDGMEPSLVRRFIEEGYMPNFDRFIRSTGNHFGYLRTTMPPQSPVAWSSFISGTNPGGHGIFDFIHRDPKSFTPYLSTSRSYDATRSLTFGKVKLPLNSGKIELMRRGKPFWSRLEEEQIPSTVYQIPANFPVKETPTKAISGMGTPDLAGSYGTLSYYSEVSVKGSKEFSGANVIRLNPIQHEARAPLMGPRDPFRTDQRESIVDLTFRRDPNNPVLTIEVQDQITLLKEGEWSDWVPIKFEYVPFLFSVQGMVRFYAKEIHPHLKIYCSPVNADPAEPGIPISSPNFSEEVAANIGRFYTQGLPADTKALSLGLLDDEEYFSQAKLVLEESMRGLDYCLNNNSDGFLFFYFSSIDQNSHMLMRAMDPNHPQYNPNASPEIKNAIRYLYKRMDDALGQALAKVDSRTLLMAISDHGFTTFYKEFHLSTWLVQQGFTVLTHPEKIEEQNFFDYVDWKKTKAYAIGFNGVYLNKSGREKHGVVSDAEGEAIVQSIIAKLAEVRDPENGQQIISNAYDAKKIYSGEFASLSPDVLVGYNKGYRISDEAALGKFKRNLVNIRENKWSADHCIDEAIVPGMLLMNRECSMENPGIWDMAPTVLRAFGLEPFPEMSQQSVVKA